jgi:RNA polymerase sigma-70 factor (ECF subfamily)
VADGREEVTDEALMLRYQGGDRSAFALLVRRHKTPVYNFILRHIRSTSVAEDLTQDVFVRVVQSAAEFRHSARFSTWMYTIARNLCIDQLRKAQLRRHPSLDQPAQSGSEDDGPTLGERLADAHPDRTVDRAAIGRQLNEHIKSAVDALPEDQREVFLLREVANIPFKDIATMIGVPENTVKSRMRYALERLQRALGEYEDYARTLK